MSKRGRFWLIRTHSVPPIVLRLSFNADWIEQITVVVIWATLVEPALSGGRVCGEFWVISQLGLKISFEFWFGREHSLRHGSQDVTFDVFGALQNLEEEAPGQERVAALRLEQRNRQIAQGLGGRYPNGPRWERLLA